MSERKPFEVKPQDLPFRSDFERIEQALGIRDSKGTLLKTWGQFVKEKQEEVTAQILARARGTLEQ